MFTVVPVSYASASSAAHGGAMSPPAGREGNCRQGAGSCWAAPPVTGTAVPHGPTVSLAPGRFSAQFKTRTAKTTWIQGASSLLDAKTGNQQSVHNKSSGKTVFDLYT